jgi:hypothetical protein
MALRGEMVGEKDRADGWVPPRGGPRKGKLEMADRGGSDTCTQESGRGGNSQGELPGATRGKGFDVQLGKELLTVGSHETATRGYWLPGPTGHWSTRGVETWAGARDEVERWAELRLRRPKGRFNLFFYSFLFSFSNLDFYFSF